MTRASHETLDHLTKNLHGQKWRARDKELLGTLRSSIRLWKLSKIGKTLQICSRRSMRNIANKFKFWPHPLFIGRNQASRILYRTIRYLIDVLLTSSGLARYDIHHGKTQYENGSLLSRSYLSTINACTHIFGTSLCQYFTYEHGILPQIVLCFPLFLCV